VALAVSLVFVCALAVGVATAPGTSATPNASGQRIPGSFPGGRYFNVPCGFSHRNNDDPIVFPGAPGKSHNHTFIGNRQVDAGTTPDELVDGSSSCDESDSSTYWVPTLYDGLEPVTPFAGLIYYIRHTDEPLQTPPAGLKLVAGNAKAKRPQAKDYASWSCGGASNVRYPSVPVCGQNSAVILNVRFPNCWNGKTLDSADHKRHMAYSTAGACPSTHPVPLPTIALVLMYPTTSKHARPSSGKFAVHGDFMNGWNQKTLAYLVAGLNPR
jgi:hypothetical protein